MSSSLLQMYKRFIQGSNGHIMLMWRAPRSFPKSPYSKPKCMISVLELSESRKAVAHRRV